MPGERIQMYSPCPRASGGGVSVICLVTSQSIGGTGVKCKINTVRLPGRPIRLHIEWQLWGCTVMVIGMMGGGSGLYYITCVN